MFTANLALDDTLPYLTFSNLLKFIDDIFSIRLRLDTQIYIILCLLSSSSTWSS